MQYMSVFARGGASGSGVALGRCGKMRDSSDAPASWAAIREAVRSGNVNATAAWLDAGGDVNATVALDANGDVTATITSKSITGCTMLMQASGSGHLKLVELLIQRQANVNLQASVGVSALMGAVVAAREGGPGSPAIVRELLRAGTDVALRNIKGYTALDIAMHF